MAELEQLQYPIGKYINPPSLSLVEREEAIATLAAFPQRLAAALSDLADSLLDETYRPGGWSIRQLVHHMADSHIAAYTGMRLAITGATPLTSPRDWPAIFPYDPDAWAALPDSNTLPAAISLKLIIALHQRWVTTLAALPESAWAQGYNHPETGSFRLDQTLASYAWHCRHHLAHINNWRHTRLL